MVIDSNNLLVIIYLLVVLILKCSMEKLAGDLLLELKFVDLEILSTSFIYFLTEELGELRSRSLGLKGSRPKI